VTSLVNVASDVQRGNKTAEGAQAELFEAIGSYGEPCLWKVFKQGSSLQDLQKQWLHGMLENVEQGFSLRDLRERWPRGKLENRSSCYSKQNVCFITGGVLLDDARFAFQLPKYWGDLRKLINMMKQQINNQGPTFTKTNGHTDHVGDDCKGDAKSAQGQDSSPRPQIMQHSLDNWGIINDALLLAETDNKFFFCEVADFECFIGVVGTGFWRAPEILHAIQNGNITSNTFTKMADVYSCAMTCYEVLRGYVSLLKVIQGLTTGGFLVERDHRCQTILIL